jgi:hypothetical protein
MRYIKWYIIVKNCNYSSKRRNDVTRHENKKNSCIKKIDEVSCKTEDDKYIYKNDNLINNKGHLVNSGGHVIASVGHLVNSEESVIYNALKCTKCFKILSCKKRLKQHELKCDGMDPLQCKVCLKVFKSKQGKYQHKKFVKCTKPVSNIINNNITNNTTNNIDNSININFNSFNNENLTNFILDKDFISEFSEILKEDDGKYAITKAMNFLYFNDNYPENQTLKKDRKNDKFVDIRIKNNKWYKTFVPINV